MSDLPAPSKLLGEAAKPSRYNTGELARDCSALLEDLLVLEVAGKVQKGTTAAKAAEWIEIIDQKFRDEGRPVPPMPEFTSIQIADGQRRAAMRALEVGERGAADLLSANAMVRQAENDVAFLTATDDVVGMVREDAGQ